MSEDKKEWIEVCCPVCSVKGKHALLFKILKCLSGHQYIEIKCHQCRQIIRVP